MVLTKKNSVVIKLILILLLVVFSSTLSARESDSTNIKINNFGGAITIQSKGISTIPNLTLGKPAAIFDMKVGRKLTFEPQFRFDLKGKPWAMVFWWRYYASIGNKVKVTLHTNYSLAYKSLTYYTSSETPQEVIRTTRYLVAAIQPNYQFNKYIGAGMYLFYNRGLESYITQNTIMLSLRPSFSNIPITKSISARINPEVYYLKMDENDGVFFTTRFFISKNECPLSVSGLITKPLRSNIPSDYDFLWNIGLSYTFNKSYVEVQ